MKAACLSAVLILVLSATALAQDSFAITPSFADIPWGSSRAVVRHDLQAKGYVFVRQDEDGDLWFNGRVSYQKSQIIEIFSPKGLVKAIV